MVRFELSEVIQSVEQLRELVAKGKRLKFLFFWGHTAPANGTINQACLSQWWPSSFEIDEVIYPTAEHFMMASKARLFGDTATWHRILACGHPKQAKEFGRQVAGFDEKKWVSERFGFVIAGNYAKFSQNLSLRNYLLETNAKILVEASPYDRIWGIGLAADDERALKPQQWRGLNLLGFALMQVRERLRERATTIRSGGATTNQPRATPWVSKYER